MRKGSHQEIGFFKRSTISKLCKPVSDKADKKGAKMQIS